jgi:hypothetical protein
MEKTGQTTSQEVYPPRPDMYRQKGPMEGEIEEFCAAHTLPESGASFIAGS